MTVAPTPQPLPGRDAYRGEPTVQPLSARAAHQGEPAPQTPSGRAAHQGELTPQTPSGRDAHQGEPTPRPLSGRDAYRDELTRLAVEDDTLLCLEADLGGKGHPFQLAHPDRFFNLGIAEATMVDMAAGLAAAGYKPFVSTFAPFAALRAAESLKLALGYLNAGITVVAPYAGVSGAWFGTTHHCLEDLAVLRSVPGVTVAAPYGEAEMRAVVREAARSGRPYYIRTGRNARYASLGDPDCAELPLVTWEFRAAPGSVCLVSVGEEGTRLALEARARTPGVAHAHLVLLDHEHLTRAAAELARHHTRFVVVEEHRAQGGIAEALALLLPRCEITSVNAGRTWPTCGGDHAEVMASLGLDLPAVHGALHRAGAHPTHHHPRSLSCTS
jgi:transketolase